MVSEEEMKRIFLVLVFALIPILSQASTAADFTVNSQPTYDVPPGSTNILILDLTLPQPVAGQTLQLQSIKIDNAGTAQQHYVDKLYIYEDGPSPGWDGDENKRFTKLSSPFFEVVMASDAFSEYMGQQRIFMTVDIASDVTTEKTIQPQLTVDSVVFANGETGPTDNAVTGFARIIASGTELPTAPIAPLAKTAEALSSSTIRWHFEDRSNNEFGFKILDGNLKEVARTEEANISYIDETGLQPDTEYSGRRIIAFNDRGESFSSALAVFPAVRTLKTAPLGEETFEEPAGSQNIEGGEGEITPEKSLLEMIQEQIAELQQEIIDLRNQLNELLEQQAAGIWQAVSGFLKSFFGE
jgi:hypothetical protein